MTRVLARTSLKALLPAVALSLSGAGLACLGTATPAMAVPQCSWANSGTYNDTYVPVAGSFPGTPACIMGRGANSDAVDALQHSMNACYGERLATDGIFGANTQAALIRTQRKVGVSVDGVYGPVTARAMKHVPVSSGSCRRISF
jgi:peptidoglycan hydrolase-like protein with peptidoglycan-binding domain